MSMLTVMMRKTSRAKKTTKSSSDGRETTLAEEEDTVDTQIVMMMGLKRPLETTEIHQSKPVVSESITRDSSRNITTGKLMMIIEERREDLEARDTTLMMNLIHSEAENTEDQLDLIPTTKTTTITVADTKLIETLTTLTSWIKRQRALRGSLNHPSTKQKANQCQRSQSRMTRRTKRRTKNETNQ